jgi:hypothetical protein
MADHWNWRSEHGKFMAAARRNYALEKRIALLEKERVKYLRRAQNAEAKLKNAFCSANRSAFSSAFLENLAENCQRPPGRYRYGVATYAAAYILKHMSPNAYDFVRMLIPMPKPESVDDTFAEEAHLISEMIGGEVGSLMEGLEVYKQQTVPNDYSNVIFEDGAAYVPCVLGVDAMAIEPYSSLSKPPEGPAVEEWYSYVFVYYLQPLDHALPNTVVEVSPHRDGKCREDVIDRVLKLRETCKQCGFLVMAVSADGDTGYSRFSNPEKNPIYRVIFEQDFNAVVRSLVGQDMCFISDMLHLLKCMRNRFATYVLGIGTTQGCTTTCADAWRLVLNVGPALTTNKGSAQLKDSLALKVFTIQNLVKILRHGLDEPGSIAEAALAGMFFAPNVLWRLANQGRNITNKSRVLLLELAYNIVRVLAEFREKSDLLECGEAGSVVFPFRRQDMRSFLVSLATLAYLIGLGVENLSLARLSTANLEHLFGLLRLGTRGDNHWMRLFRRLVHGQMVTRIADRHDICLGKKRVRNIAGTVAARDDSEGMRQVCEVESGFGGVLLEVALGRIQEGNNLERYQGMVAHLSGLRDDIDARQTDPTVTRLGGSLPFPRILMVHRLGEA